MKIYATIMSKSTNIFRDIVISQHRLRTWFYRLELSDLRNAWQFYAWFDLWMIIANLRPIFLWTCLDWVIWSVSWRFVAYFYDFRQAFEWRKRTGEAAEICWGSRFSWWSETSLKESGQKAASEAAEAAEAPEVRSWPCSDHLKSLQVVAIFGPTGGLSVPKVVLSWPILSRSFPSDQYLRCCLVMILVMMVSMWHAWLLGYVLSYNPCMAMDWPSMSKLTDQGKERS